MTKRLALVAGPFTALMAMGLAAPAFAQMNCKPREQWYTGSLMSPSGALPKGVALYEPYLGGAVPVTRFDANGNAHNAHSTAPRNINEANVLAYGLTDDLTIQTIPNFAVNFDSAHTSHGLVAGDLPLTVKYRLVNSKPEECVPGVSFIGGLNVPFGSYDQLSTYEQGGGSGAWLGNFGVQSQMSIEMPDGNPLRVRLWVRGSQPFASVGLQGMSVYGTARDFSGHAYLRTTGEVGASLEYGITKEWVLALDIVDGLSNGGRVTGMNLFSGPTNYHLNTSNSFALAPAVEYNFNDKYGIILGAVVNPAGHNSTGAINPQIAFDMVF